MSIIANRIEAKYDKSPAWLAWLVCLSGGLLFFYEFIQLNMFNAINTGVMKSFGVNVHHLGWLSSMYFYADAGFLFLAGNLLDRFSTRRWILVAMTLCTVGTIGFSLAPSLLIASIFRFVVGIGAAFCFLSGLRLATRWFPASRIALMSGLLVTMAMVGGWVAQAPLTALVQALGWRSAIFMDGLLGVALTVWVFFVVKDAPKHAEHRIAEDAAKLKQRGLLASLSHVIFRRPNWSGGLYIALMNLPIYLLGALWGTMFLQQVYPYSATASAVVTSMLYLGTIIGSPAMGWISDLFGKRCLPMGIAAVISTVIVMIIMYVPALSFNTMMGLFFILGLITSAQVIGYPFVSESNHKEFTGAAVSIATMIVLLSGAFMQPISGAILDHYWTGQFSGGVHSYSLSAYQHAMWIFPISFMLALAISIIMKETNCQHLDDESDEEVLVSPDTQSA